MNKLYTVVISSPPILPTYTHIFSSPSTAFCILHPTTPSSSTFSISTTLVTSAADINAYIHTFYSIFHVPCTHLHMHTQHHASHHGPHSLRPPRWCGLGPSIVYILLMPTGEL